MQPDLPHAKTRNKPGVYRITHVASGKVYVGSCANLYNRKYHHTWSLKKRRHENSELQAAYDLDPELKWEMGQCRDREHAYYEEQLLLDLHKGLGNVFNKAFDAKKNSSVARSQEYRQRISDCMKGRIISTEHRKKLSEAASDWRNDSSKNAKALAARRARAQAIEIDGVRYSGIWEASEKLGIPQQRIANRIRSQTPQYSTWQMATKSTE